MEKINFSVFTRNIVIEQEVINSAEAVNDDKKLFVPEFFQNIESAIDYLTYGQVNSRLFVADFDALQEEEIKNVIRRIYNDPWLHGTVIVIIAEKISHIAASELIQDGVVDFISMHEIQYKLPTVIKISNDNSEIFETQQFSKEIKTHKKGNLLVKNNLSLVPKVTSTLMSFCYAVGFRNLDHFSRISLSLHEMVTNSIEHGNCEIGFDKKTEIILKNKSMAEMVREITKDPKFANRKVKITYDIGPDKAIFTIEDEGKGFQISDLPDPTGGDNIFAVHGRGIMMTKSFADEMNFNEKGNQVTMIFYNNYHYKSRENILTQFATDGILKLNSGDTLIEDGSDSYYFYYIVQGKLGVFYKEKMVDTLTPEDIFVGEMAFLNRNKRTGTVKALSEVTVLPISRRGFIDMIKTFPYSGVVLARLLTKRLARRNKIELD